MENNLILDFYSFDEQFSKTFSQEKYSNGLKIIFIFLQWNLRANRYVFVK